MLLDQNARRQRLGRVVIEHRNRGLQDDGPRIELRRDEVHGRARDSDAMSQCLLLRVEPWKRGKERRVNIEYPLREGLEHRRANQSHEPGKAHEINVAGAQQVHNRAVVGIPLAVVPRAQTQGLDPGLSGAPETGRLGST